MSAGWAALEAELDLWRASGTEVTVWWRDDDAVEPTRALDRLTDLAQRFRVPLALAVVPTGAGDALARDLGAKDQIQIVQHGWAHQNHAEPPARVSEFPASRPAAIVADELAQGCARLKDLFGTRFVPLFVPPWNRIDAGWLPMVRTAGLQAISTFAPRMQPCENGLVRVNTHVDPIAWKRGRLFQGVDKSLSMLIGHLAARRLGQVDPLEPTGFLTHHLVHQPDLWDFIELLLIRLSGDPIVRFCDPASLLLDGD